jgi:hypothetical protein
VHDHVEERLARALGCGTRGQAGGRAQHAALPVAGYDAHGSRSFLKKRTKKLLRPPPPDRAFRTIRARHKLQKFLLLFSKRSAVLPFTPLATDRAGS